MAILTETYVECGNSGDSLTKGDGKCNQCGGTGIDIGVAVLSGYEGDCEKCGGTGVCSACHGTGLRPASEGVDESDSFENSTLNDKNQILTNELAEEELAWIKKVEDYRNSPGDLRLPDCHEGINSGFSNF